MNHLHAPHGCTHCACNNPVMNLLKDSLFSKENLEEIKAGIQPPKTEAATPQPMIFTGGTIITLAKGQDFTPVDAIGFADGKVILAGSLTDVQSAMNNAGYQGLTPIVLASGQTLLPGLIEPHVHIVPSAAMSSWAQVGPFTGQILTVGYSTSAVAVTLNEYYANSLGNYDVLLGNGLDPALLTLDTVENKSAYPTVNNTVLDTFTPNIPVMLLSASGHTLYLNTLAYQYVHTNNLDIRLKYKTYQDYVNATGGILQEGAQMKPALDLVQPQIAERLKNFGTEVTQLFQEANSRGVTFMYDALMSDEYMALLTAYALKTPLPVHMGCAHHVESIDDLVLIDHYTPPTKYTDFYQSHLKLISDGSNQGLSGYQSQPYLCDPTNYGVFDIPFTTAKPSGLPTQYQNFLNAAIRDKGWPLMIHANGDEAVTYAITAYQEALTQYSGEELRHRIEHCSLLTIDQIKQMVKSGISPSFLIGHVGYWGYSFQNVIFGVEKANTLDLCKSSLDHGLKITLHSDNPVTPLGPLRLMEQSITRIMEADPDLDSLNPDECLTARQALTAVTKDAAWQCYAEQWVGTLDTNLFADFVILANNPLAMQTGDISMKMRNIPVVSTWVGGVQVYPQP